MNILTPSIRLVDALSEWGLREVMKYPAMEIPPNKHERTAFGTEVVLRHVPQLIARLLHAEPFGVAELHGVLRVDFGPEECDELLFHDGVSLRVHAARVGNNGYVRRLVETPDARPLVYAVQIADEDRPMGPVAIYDGWHRAAAWLIRAQEGLSSRLTADLVKTRRSPLVQVYAR